MISSLRSRRAIRPIQLAIAIISIVFANAAVAQTTGSIRGTVRDAAARTPLVSATVTLRDANDSSARPLGDLTDANGAFVIERVPVGKQFRLEVSFIGYDKHVVERVAVSADKLEANIGEVFLEASAVDVDAVQVTADRPDVRVTAEKTVYAVENNPSYTATTVSELLGQVPSIQVDQDGKVSLRGNDNVTIMMNDRPLSMPNDQLYKFLQTLPANIVKDIEVRTNPGAQFDAKNDGGIINIVTRRTMSDMFGGSVNAGADTRGGFNGGGNLYYNGNELTASLGGGANSGANSSSNSGMRINRRDPINARDDGSGSSESTSGSYNGYGQADYKFTDNDLVSFSFNVNHWSWDQDTRGFRTYYNAGDVVTARSFDTSAPPPGSANEGGYRGASFLYKHTFKEDHKISLDVSYNGHGYTGESESSNTFFDANGVLDSLRSTQRTMTYDRDNSTIITLLDYNNPISDMLTLSVGAKNEMNFLDNSTSVRNLDHRLGEFVVDSLQTNHYLPENSIYAGYGQVSYRPIEELSVQAGLRVEAATVSAAYASGAPIITRNYTNFFPSGALGYNFDQQNSLTLSYRRSVALPDIDALNPTRIRYSEFVEFSGNPDLEPEFTHSLSLAYNTFWGMGNMITVSPYYSSTEGNIESSQEFANGVTHSSTKNFNGAYSIGSDASIALKPASWLNFRIGGDVFQKVNRGSDVSGDSHSEAWGYNANATLNIDPMEGMTISGTMYSSVPAVVGASETSGWSYWSFNIRQRLLDKKLTISLRINDPFDLQKWENIYDTPDFRTEMMSKWSSRFVGLNVSYMFGTTPRMEQHKQDKTETKGSSGAGGAGGGGGGQ